MAVILVKSNDLSLKTLVSELREKIEVGIRNLAAHEVASITDEVIREKTGYTSHQIMQKVKEAFGYTGARIPEGAWRSYDAMNQLLTAYLNRRTI